MEEGRRETVLIAGVIVWIILCVIIIIIVPNLPTRIIAGVVIIISIVYLQKTIQKLRKIRNDAQYEISSLRLSISSQIEDMGLDSETFLENALVSPAAAPAPASLSPSEIWCSEETSYGLAAEGCLDGLVEQDGCCVLPPEEQPSAAEAAFTGTATMGLMVLQAVAVDKLIKGLPDIIKFLSGNMSEEAIEKAMRGGKMGRRMGKVLSKVSRKLTGRNMMSAVAKTRMQFARRL